MAQRTSPPLDNPELASGTYLAVLTAFASYGFRKTYMAALAEAAGVARQTLYNRFDSKEAILIWAVNGLTLELRQNAVSALDAEDKCVSKVLFNCLHHWIGPVGTLFHSGLHASEIFALGAELENPGNDPLFGVGKPIEQFLIERGVFTEPKQAKDLVFVLIMAAKGLMLKSQSEAEFRRGLTRVIRGVGLGEL